MILQSEIIALAAKNEVPTSTVDKNWVLGHFIPIMNTMKDVLVPCYSITEIVAEKFRSLLQRSYPAPRDYYDLWYLVPHLSDGNIKIMLNTFQTKAQFKGVNLKSYHDFFDESQIKKMQRAWKNSLEEHLSPGNLPSVETVISELKQFCQGQNWTNHLKQ